MIQGPSFFRYLAALCYDFLILFSVCLLTMALLVFFEARTGLRLSPAVHALVLVGVSYALYTCCWCQGGQTLGALAWRLRVVRPDGRGLNWKQASRRFAVGLCSLPFLGTWQVWALFHPQQQTLVDQLSGTRLQALAQPGQQ